MRKQFKAPPSPPKKTPISSSFHFQCSSDAFTIGLAPVWVDDREEVSVKFQRIRTKMGELVKAHARALMPIE
ncbi:hypothetical protein NC653_033278 [Populus alba x Populus x berolinensis]|uniref:Uncharacterized protein n=1 Tax=Populus alba x Populus x berolinensis TaxID=444605 RepID=A0AAD6LTJ2_9ROSI|nr:hypothetical protein NC653_033278 [Populus alba x Populus x berolinensis]